MRMVDAPLSCVDPLFEASPWRLLRHPRDASRFPGRIVVDPAPAAFRWRRSGCPGLPPVSPGGRSLIIERTSSDQDVLRSASRPVSPREGVWSGVAAGGRCLAVVRSWSGERSRSGMNRIMSRNTTRSAAYLKRFYDLLSVLEHRIGGPRRLVNCSGRMDWPCRGVYFFRETGEERSGSGSGPRVVRIGTHTLKPGAGTRLNGDASKARATAYKIIVPSIRYLGSHRSTPPGYASS